MTVTIKNIECNRYYRKSCQKGGKIPRRVRAASVWRDITGHVRDHHQREGNESGASTCNSTGREQERQHEGTKGQAKPDPGDPTRRAPNPEENTAGNNQVASEEREVGNEVRRHIQRCPLTVELS